MESISLINEVAKAYFEAHPELDVIPAKKLMPDLISKGLFVRDEKNGLPLRKLLKQIDAAGDTDQIPQIHVVRKGKHSFWYFKREGHTPEGLEVENIPAKEETRKKLNKREDSDASYVIDLCDKALDLTAVRRHTFDYLKGDMHRNGRTRSKLPCDAYYSSLKLVVEYIAKLVEVDPDQFDTPAQLSATGKTRNEMREIYAARKREVLPKHKMQLIELDASLFKLDEHHLIIRDEVKDLAVIKKALQKVKKKKETSS